MNGEYRLEKLPGKVESFIKRLDRKIQRRIDEAFEYILRSPFRHSNPTVIRRLHGKKKGLYRYRLGDVRIIYRVNGEEKSIRILQIDNRGDIY